MFYSSTNVSRLLISVWTPANKKRKHVKTYDLTPQLTVNNMYVCFNGELLHTQNNYFDTTVYTEP